MKANCLWIHGWGMSPAIWGNLGEMLPEARHSLFSYAGCDTSAKMREAVRAAIVKEAELSAAQYAPFAVIGWSLGGMLAMDVLLELHEEEPMRAFASLASITTVVMIGSTLRFTGDDRSRAQPARVVRRMRTQLAANREETLRLFAGSMLSASERAAEEAEVDEARYSLFEQCGSITDFTPAGLDAGLGYLLEADLSERWNRVGSVIPEFPRVVWLHGRDDPICPSGAVPECATDGNLAMFEKAGHVPFLTERARFGTIMRGIVYGCR